MKTLILVLCTLLTSATVQGLEVELPPCGCDHYESEPHALTPDPTGSSEFELPDVSNQYGEDDLLPDDLEPYVGEECPAESEGDESGGLWSMLSPGMGHL